MNSPVIHDALAELLRYPDASYAERLDRCCTLLREQEPELSERLRSARELLASLPLEDQEERFTLAFDLNPVCSLELGWHLFGENYDRGDLMARLRRELARHSIQENGELPDHLTHVIPLLGRMEAGEADDFFAACAAPALSKMQSAFKSATSDPFAIILDVICRWLHLRHGSLVSNQPPAPVLLPVLQESAYD